MCISVVYKYTVFSPLLRSYLLSMYQTRYIWQPCLRDAVTPIFRPEPTNTYVEASSTTTRWLYTRGRHFLQDVYKSSR
jgi:hypothetical protein